MMGIYQIKNVENNKIYVGSSVNLNERWRLHKCNLVANKHNNSYLQRSWNKYGEESFSFSVLCKLNTTEEILRIIENMYIYNLAPVYNLAKFATKSPMYKRHHTEKSKQKMSKAAKGNTRNKGRKHSEESKKNMSIAHYGITHTKETRMAISKTLMGRNVGENCGTSKLKECEVLEIRRLYATDKFSQTLIGKIFNVSRHNIGAIVNRKSWKHI